MSNSMPEEIKFAIYDPHWPTTYAEDDVECVWCDQSWPCEDAQRAERQYQRVMDIVNAEIR